jgi:RhtB (resistance to homoserine/threonine) family protein
LIDSKTWVMFTVAALAVIASPGPDIFYVLSRAMSAGRRAGSLSALGIASGEVVHTLLAVFGLAALLRASTVAFSVLKYFGAVYLVYLGVRAIFDRSGTILENSQRATDWKVFRQAVFTNLFNPKAILFYVTFLPQFVNPSHGHAQFQLVVLGLTFALLDVLVLEVLARSAGSIYSWLSQNARNERTIKWGTGTVLVGLGIRMAFLERK